MSIELASTISGAPASRWKRYPAYKDSGVEWLGEVPEGWEMKRMDAFTSIFKHPVSAELLSGQEVFHYSIPIVQEKGTGQLEDGDGIESNKTLITEQVLLVSKLNPRKGTIALASPQHAITVCSGEFVPLVPRKSVPKYLEYVYCSEDVRQLLSSRVESVTKSHQRVNPIEIYKMFWSWPPLPEQRTIATFLDRETGRIDALIEKKGRQIELLQEKRAALISHAVTKGLDPDVKMKDSGVKLLGEVPKHWELKKLKYLVLGFLKYGANESAELEDTNLPRYIRITDFGDDGKLKQDTFKSLPHEIAKDYLLENGDILFARSGATVGKTFQFKNHEKSACFAGYLIKASPDEKKVLSDYLYLFTKSNSYEMWKNSIFIKATIQNIGADKYNSLTLSVPPLPEQRAIAAFLDRETGRIDTLTTKIRESILKLREYRTALISAAVTGKIDVREGV